MADNKIENDLANHTSTQDLASQDLASQGLTSQGLTSQGLAGGIIIAAPCSGSGKTVVTLGLLRALARRKLLVRSLKVGPDYIDPAFHSVASGQPAYALDLWAMRSELQCEQLLVASEGADIVIAEGVMGLFDGSASGVGSTADVAKQTGWPIVLVVDVQGQGASAAALVRGFATHHPQVRIAGVILNRVGSDTHEAMICDAMNALHLPELEGHPVLGAIKRRDAMSLPERHLGLVQASEHKDLDHWISYVADIIDECIDIESLINIACPSSFVGEAETASLPPLGNHIAIAHDTAFAFTYEHILDGWHSGGAALSFFSPLNDEAPDPTADAVYLPGGYPELHANTLSNANTFRAGMAAVAARNGIIFGECGGYMTLGQAMIDREGQSHEMLGLLPVVTSFEKPRLHLGYRQLTTLQNGAFGSAGAKFRGHEFHYASEFHLDSQSNNGSSDLDPLFEVCDSFGNTLPQSGCIKGRTFGSFLHLIDREA